ALEIEPNNVDLLFNLGVVAADQGNVEEAKKYYDMAIKTDDTYVRAYMNTAALILGQEQGIIDEMNGLGTSAADDKRYEELQDSRMQLYNDAVPYLTKVLEFEPNNINAARTLMNIYSVLGDTPNFKAMQAKIDAMEGDGN
ncbi:MAG: tetratricopeptide repeat protein, partial [Bacteroidia bacterium]|nr:tetratricopeptide repeat protein [Bacteroidia bacterium]